MPELNDEFVQKISSLKTVDEYKSSVRTNLEAVAERDALLKQREEIVQLAVDNMTVDLPPVMIDNRVQMMIEDLEANLNLQGINLEVYLAGSGRTLDDLRKDYRSDAEKNLRIDMMLEEVSRLENIQVEDTDVNMEIARMASIYRASPKQIVKALQDNGQIQTVISNVRHKKAMQFIIDNMAGADKSDDDSATDSTVAETEKVETSTDEKSDTTVDKN